MLSGKAVISLQAYIIIFMPIGTVFQWMTNAQSPRLKKNSLNWELAVVFSIIIIII
jgi:hypothetical protein